MTFQKKNVVHNSCFGVKKLSGLGLFALRSILGQLPHLLHIREQPVFLRHPWNCLPAGFSQRDTLVVVGDCREGGKASQRIIHSSLLSESPQASAFSLLHQHFLTVLPWFQLSLGNRSLWGVLQPCFC